MSEPADQPSKTKTRSIESLLPEKAAVETSLGTLYVRHANVSDWTQLQHADPISLGELGIRKLVGRSQEKRDLSPLGDDDFNALQNEDLDKLAAAIAARNGLGTLPAGPALEVLGQSLIEEQARQAAQINKMLEDSQKLLSRGYDFLGENTLNKLQAQVAKLNEFNISNAASEALKNALRSPELSSDVKGAFASARALNEAMRGSNALTEAMRQYGKGGSASDILTRAHAAGEALRKLYGKPEGAARTNAAVEAMRRQYGEAEGTSDSIARAHAAGEAMRRSSGSSNVLFDIPKRERCRDTNADETNALSDIEQQIRERSMKAPEAGTVALNDAVPPVNTAENAVAETDALEHRERELPTSANDLAIEHVAIESVETAREVLEKVESMHSVMGALNGTLINEVIPEWFNNSKHTKRGLYATIILSIVTTVVATLYQVNVAQDLDRQNAVHQTAMESLLRQQLSAQQALIAQQARQAAELRAMLEVHQLQRDPRKVPAK